MALMLRAESYSGRAKENVRIQHTFVVLERAEASQLKSGSVMNEHTLETNEARRQTNRGRNATRPSEIPRQGWKDIAIRVKNEIAADNLSIIAAGVAFYSFMSILPALAAFLSI